MAQPDKISNAPGSLDYVPPPLRSEQKRDLEAIGGRLKSARKRSGVSQIEAAAAAGVTRPTVSNWEAGRNMPSLLQLRVLLSLYGVMASQILFDQNPFELTEAEAHELLMAARFFSDSLRRKVDTLLSVLPRA